eukprot:TRINITY_DN20757_c0_g1_i1.p1 TRINITY_DN20757_c0_g1~~TRINITY_DN20757_c0_g1_i1.p1  ORF type:complete len:168 (-),score=38.22 TRINITY_DN20757_c0_g1_i1:99-602(-)
MARSEPSRTRPLRGSRPTRASLCHHCACPVSLASAPVTNGSLRALSDPPAARLSAHARLFVPPLRVPGIFGIRPSDQWLEELVSHCRHAHMGTAEAAASNAQRAAALSWGDALAAYLMHQRVPIHTTGRFGAVRVAVHLYNAPAELEALCEAVEAFVALPPSQQVHC